jgi:hypothetical protein
MQRIRQKDLVNLAITERLALAIYFKVGTWNAEAIEGCIAIMSSISESQEYSNVGVAI